MTFFLKFFWQKYRFIVEKAKYTLKPIADELTRLLRKKVTFVDETRGEKLKQATGNTGFIPANIGDAYILKGDCSEKTLDYYREAIQNMTDGQMIREAQQKAYAAMEHCYNKK